MKRIIRVFPQRTSCTPDDEMVFIGLPTFKEMIPEHDEVHISCTFTWDREYCKDLKFIWEAMTDKPVLLGGPAFGSKVKGFQQGMYVKSDVIFTSRGCNNNCSFCIVPKLEGKLRELPISTGNIIQDNNFLQCTREHKEKVFQMLKTQRAICFKGGLESKLIDDHFLNCLEDLGTRKLDHLYLACDNDKALEPLREAVSKLHQIGLNQEKIRCYALIGGKDADLRTMEKNEARLQEIFKIGAMPFAQLYQHFEDKKIEYGRDWKKFASQWSRPASVKAHCLKGTSYKDFNK